MGAEQFEEKGGDQPHRLHKEGTKWVEEEGRGGQNHRQVRMGTQVSPLLSSFEFPFQLGSLAIVTGAIPTCYTVTSLKF